VRQPVPLELQHASSLHATWQAAEAGWQVHEATG
jgi:hypothetical protein